MRPVPQREDVPCSETIKTDSGDAGQSLHATNSFSKDLNDCSAFQLQREDLSSVQYHCSSKIAGKFSILVSTRSKILFTSNIALSPRGTHKATVFVEHHSNESPRNTTGDRKVR